MLTWLLKDGLPSTLLLTVTALVIGFVVGFAIALMQIYGTSFLRTLAAYCERIIRSIPILVLMFITYFALPRFGIPLPPFESAYLALGIHSSAYQSQIFRGAIESIPGGQMLAARSIGMSKLKAIRNVILPQALRLSIPSWSNEVAAVTKQTSFAFTVGVFEMMRIAENIRIRSLQPLPAFLLCAMLYFIIIFTLTRSLGYIGNRFRIPGLERGA